MDKIKITLKNIALKGQPFLYAMVMRRGGHEILFPIGELNDAKIFYMKCLHDVNLLEETWTSSHQQAVA